MTSQSLITRCLACCVLLVAAAASRADVRQMEKLDRGVVALSTGTGVFVSWRLLIRCGPLQPEAFT